MRSCACLFAVLLSLFAVVPAAAGPSGYPGIIISVRAAPVSAAINTPVSFTVQTRGVCSDLVLDFGDGTSALLGGAGTTGANDTHALTQVHSYAVAGVRVVTAKPASVCVHQATTTVTVSVPAGARGPLTASTTPVLVPPVKKPGITLSNQPVTAPFGQPQPAFTLTTVYFNYPAWGMQYTTSTDGTFLLPKPSPTGAPLLNDNSVYFTFKSQGVPPQALHDIDSNCVPGARLGACPARFTLRSEFGDIGPLLDFTAKSRIALPNGIHGPIFVTAPIDLRSFLNTRYRVTLEVASNGRAFTSAPAFIKPGAPIPSYFESKVYPTFKSARCSTCHSLGDHATLTEQHTLPGQTVPFTGIMLTSDIQPNRTAGCDGCHNQTAHVSEWMTPGFEKGINWSKMNNWLEVCQAVIKHLPTKAARQNHFHNDPRLKWAITYAVTPGPYVQVLSKAPPGDWGTWLDLVDKWSNLDDPCAH